MNSNKAKALKQSAKKRGKYLATRHSHIVRYPGNNLYYLFWKHKGKRYELSLETDVESRALIKADEKIKEIKSRLAQGAPTTNTKVSLDELLTLFLTAQKRRVEAYEFKQRSYEAIEDGVKKIRRECPALLSREAARVSFKELDDYVHGIRTSQSPTTLNKVVDAFKSA